MGTNAFAANSGPSGVRLQNRVGCRRSSEHGSWRAGFVPAPASLRAPSPRLPQCCGGQPSGMAADAGDDVDNGGADWQEKVKHAFVDYFE